MTALPVALQTSPRPRPPGRGSLLASGLGVFLFVAYAAAMAYGFAVYSGVSASVAHMTGEAEVTGAEVRTEGRGYRFGEVRFLVDGHAARCVIATDEVPRIRVGARLPYWHRDGRLELEPCTRYMLARAPVRKVLFALLGGIALIAAALIGYRARRTHRLFTRGQGATGTLRSTESLGAGGWKYALQIDVAGPLNVAVRIPVRRSVLLRIGPGRLPVAGDRVHVVYDPTNPRHFALWSFEPAVGS